MRLRKKPREDREPQPMFVVCEQDDCRRPKYLVNGVPAGFEREQAERLAMRATPNQVAYDIVPVEVFTWARAAGEPMSSTQAIKQFADLQVDEEAM